MIGILISVKPQWVAPTLRGYKTVEIRKGPDLCKAINELIAKQGVAPVLMYCTKGKPYLYKTEDYESGFALNGVKYNGKVVARYNATAEKISYFNVFVGYVTDTSFITDVVYNSYLTFAELHRYLQGKIGTAIHIHNLEIFDKPKEISELHKIDNSCGDICFQCPHLCTDDSVGYSFDSCDLEECEKTRLTRAPQSWCYVEVF